MSEQADDGGTQGERRDRLVQQRVSRQPRLAQALRNERRPVVIVADDAALAGWTVESDWPAGLERPRLLDGGLAAWKKAGLPVEASADSPPDADCIDYLFFVHDRHDGNKEAARRYLAWETGLVQQLDAQEIAAFRLPTAEHAHG